jgi:signal transduction histidine kinase
VTRRPSAAWLIGAAVAALTAIAAGAFAVQYQQSASKPVGEGELFVLESSVAQEQMEAFASDRVDDATAVRRIRNGLNLEAVAIVSPEGLVMASTSTNLEGTVLDNELLLFGLASRSMSAVAAPVSQPILIDGVIERDTGTISYQVLQPLQDGRALLLHYDISELLERRARGQGIQSVTLQLLGASAFFLLLTTILVVGRSFVKRDFREMAFEAEVLRRQSAELEQHNRELSAARAEAERALALAEEKNRIRAEFVLMINHELRTPLTTVVTGAELLSEGSDLSEQERANLLKQMTSDGHRLQEMIGQMLVVARIENRGLNFTMRDVAIADLLDDLDLKHPRIVIDRHLVELVPFPVEVRTDFTTLSQLLSSLIDNAMTHGASQVVLRAVPDLPFEPIWKVGHTPSQAAYLLVEDDGPGIDPDFLPRAFEKFEKHSRSSGTGLGLYMARMMIEALGGSLAVNTSPAGTTMAVAVPLSSARVPAGALR